MNVEMENTHLWRKSEFQESGNLQVKGTIKINDIYG